MKVSRRKIAEVINDQIESGESLSKLSKEIAAYLLAEGRYSELPSLMRDVMELRAGQGLVEVTATSAFVLDSKVKTDLVQLVKAAKPKTKKVIIDEKINSDLVGGLKLDMINQSLDLSIKAKLNRLKQLSSPGGV